MNTCETYRLVLDEEKNEIKFESNFGRDEFIKSVLESVDNKLINDRMINNCENCYNYNSLIDWREGGVFHQCLEGNNLWEKCNDYDPIEEDVKDD